MKKIQILQINDVHGYIKEHDEYFFTKDGIEYKKAGGYSRIKTVIENAQKEGPVLALDGGDTFHGTKPVVKSKGEILIPILNHLELDGMSGHWDFAYGPKHLKHLVSKLNYPFLSCNVYNKDDDSLTFDAYKIIEKGDLSILVIGLSATIIDKTMPDNFSEGIYLTDGLDEVNALSEKYRDEVDLIVVNSHMGYPQDVHLASNTKGVDVWLSAHTHNRLYEPTYINDTVLIQSGSNGSFIGKLEITLDEDVKYISHELIVLDEKIEESASMLAVIDTLDLDEDLSVVGKTELPLARKEVLNSDLDALLLEAICKASKTNIAFSNGWRYGPVILKGEISKDDIINMIPMNPDIMKVTLTGQEIKDMLEENIERTFSSDPMSQMGGYLKRVFGLKIYFKIENSKGRRIQEIYTQDAPLIYDQSYQVSYITQQGVSKKYGQDHTNTKIKAQDALLAYLKKEVFKKESNTWMAI